MSLQHLRNRALKHGAWGETAKPRKHTAEREPEVVAIVFRGGGLLVNGGQHQDVGYRERVRYGTKAFGGRGKPRDGGGGL